MYKEGSAGLFPRWGQDRDGGLTQSKTKRK
jgi:hypothetical protein